MMVKEINSKRIISFVILLISYIFFIGAITKNWYGWDGGWGYFWIGLLTFIYSWILYYYEFRLLHRRS